MQNASTTIAVSQEEAYYDKLMKAKEVKIVYNGMNLEDFDNLPKKGSFKEKYNINSPFILYLGRIDKLKGINILIQSFSQLPEKFSDYKLVIAGKVTEYKNELDVIIKKNNLQDRVIFTGFVKEEDKISVYHDAELFVNPVKYMGGVSITVFESILSNTPVIVTPESGELIEKIDAGTIVKYGDISQLTIEMINSLNNKDLTYKQLRNGQSYIRNNLDWNDVSKNILDIYENVIRRKDIK
jgi:glycosyltransferase involved in cell wall biosynthesis